MKLMKKKNILNVMSQQHDKMMKKTNMVDELMKKIVNMFDKLVKKTITIDEPTKKMSTINAKEQKGKATSQQAKECILGCKVNELNNGFQIQDPCPYH